MRQPPDPTALPCVCTSLRKASRAVTRIYDAALAPAGLTAAQLALLRNIKRAGTMPLSKLAELLVLDRTSLYRALAPMTRDGWITVAAGESGRAKHASLTQRGEGVLADADVAWDEAQRRVVGALGVEQWADLQARIATLTALAANGAIDT